MEGIGVFGGGEEVLGERQGRLEGLDFEMGEGRLGREVCVGVAIVDRP